MTHYERALAVTPGASQTRSKAPGNIGPLDEFPLFAVGGSGMRLFCDDGREYWDCIGANCAVPLGYGCDAVNGSVFRAAMTGPLLSLPSLEEAKVSERFLEACAPWAQSVRWVKTGSEAMSAAVRLARIATARTKVVVLEHSYHGWHDWTYARFGDWHERGGVLANGVPPCLTDTIVTASMSESERIDEELKDAAAFVVEAPRFEPFPHTSWLRDRCSVARRLGAVVIFDEMVYGMRWRRGGASEFFGVQPDLACFGKAIGNGFPVACVCGARDIMAPAAAFVSGTYGGDLVGLAAVGAVLYEYGKQDVIGYLWETGRTLRAAFAEVQQSQIKLDGYPVHWRVLAGSPEQMADFQRAAAKIGVLVSRHSNNASAAITLDEAHRIGRLLGCAAIEVQR